MENKLKKIDSLSKIDYNGYQKILKSSWEELVGAPEPIGFALIAGTHLPWKNAKPQELEEQPLLYLGAINKWKTELNGHDTMTLKDFSYGECKVVAVGKAIHVYLVPAKGKLTDDKLLKPIKKELKKFKPKVFLEVVDDLSAVEDSTQETDGAEQATDDLSTLGRELQKYHTLSNRIKEKVATTSGEEKQALQIQYQQVIRRLKHLVGDWADSIAPEAATLIVGKEAETWQKIYQKWQAYFDKRQAAKEGQGDEEGNKAEEERLYTKLGKDIELFYSSIEKGELLEVELIETNLENLKEHYKRWSSFVKGKQSQFPDELVAAKELLQNTIKTWPKLKPLLSRSKALQQQLAADSNQGDLTAMARTMQQLATIQEQLNNIA